LTLANRNIFSVNSLPAKDGSFLKRALSALLALVTASESRTIFVADAHRGDGKRFVVQANEKLTAFGNLKSTIRARGN
jgi:hypothetical protein